ncbi:MAG: DNA alkylation repair protein [Acidobacteria bacterium]|nr:MAG: DNA alkylation repair protein [Acidobacteriota bacterium]
MNLKEITTQMEALSNSGIASHSQRFFKTGPGEYGHGDLFRGIRVPKIRQLSRKYKKLSLNDTLRLLKSAYHEDRQLALFIMVLKYKSSDPDTQKQLVEFYLSHTAYINNWDLVDGSAPQILGTHLLHTDRSLLYRLADSDSLWERRIAVLACFTFIRHSSYDDILKLAAILLHDPEDLMHKAIGWMLREVGKRDFQTEDEFLKTHYRQMPRTMLRYAIEKYPEEKRQAYLKGIV